ncbi:butyrophilin-like protein 3 isoform X1 [Rana temporaria]|uniref:butyrophilin-like protein 3 isoform X1 n=1 Tax=Rana temporaria TaxID=8407 RepID=UPI001AACBB6D|nr:butyrophilin-like protein 3 isoform X1 [Rana temporaria]
MLFGITSTGRGREQNTYGGEVTSQSTMAFKSQVTIVMCTLLLPVSCLDETEVVASLYGTVTLRCWFPFIQGREGLSVVWEKNDKDGRRSIAHKFIDGQDNLRDQDINYTGRTELSGDFSYGTVDLTLREVTFNDEGTYYCRAANRRGHWDKKVDLTIGNLNAEESTVTVIHIDGKKRLKCIAIGVFRNPWVKWYDEKGFHLSEHGTRNITDIRNGRKMVESVLNLDVETNKSYFCLLREGRLKRTARAVLSDPRWRRTCPRAVKDSSTLT